MKKLAIAGASVALAAMPVVGVFAATSVTTQDTVTVTVPSGCTVNDTARSDKLAEFGSIAPGDDSASAETTTAISFSCNGAWSVKPTTSGLAGTTGTTITSAAANAKGSQFKLQLTAGNTESNNGGTITNPFSTATGIDNTSAVAGTASAFEVTLTPAYTIHIGNGQEADTYEGTVLYTVALAS